MIPTPIGLFYVGRVRPVGVTRGNWNPLPPHGHTVCSSIIRGGGWRTARVPGPCAGCNDWIECGDPYLDTGVRMAPTMSKYRLCITCAYARITSRA